MKDGYYRRDKLVGSIVHKRTLGILGLGKVGREVAWRMQRFGMILIGHDPFVDDSIFNELKVTRVSLDNLFENSDYLTIHCVANEKTENLIDGPALKMKMKPGIRIINTASARVIEENALLNAVQTGQVTCVALDRFATEPPTSSYLLEHPRVICTPHSAANTYEARMQVGLEVADQIIAAVNGDPINSIVVNISGKLEADELLAEEWNSLCNDMGRLASIFVCPRNISNITIKAHTYEEKYLKQYPNTLAALLAGYLQEASNGEASLFNAEIIAKRFSIIRQATKHFTKKPQNMVSAANNALAVMIYAKGHSIRLVGSVVDKVKMIYSINKSVLTTPLVITGGITLIIYEGQKKCLGKIAASLTSRNIDIEGVVQVVNRHPNERFFIVLTKAVRPSYHMVHEDLTYLGFAKFQNISKLA